MNASLGPIHRSANAADRRLRPISGAARLSAQENDALKVLAPVVPTRIKPSMRDALNSPDEIVHCQGNFAAADRIDVVGIEFDNTANLRWFFHRLSPVF